MKSRIQSYLQFLWHSKNEHGVHSPFVFLFLTKALYNKKMKMAFSLESFPSIKNSKKMQLLFKISRYFEPKSIHLIGSSDLEKKILSLGSLSAEINSNPKHSHYDCVYFSYQNGFSISIESLNQLLKTTHNDSFWILEKIHSHSEAKLLWKTLKQHPKVTVTIDLYYFGLVFFRKEQPKQHFVIRP